jgi:glyoxylase-like metal-dependent hydrolase (beta-lactamase superfamily II)
MQREAARIESLIPGLHATAPEPLPFAPELEVRAFLLRRRHGNVLMYSTSTVAGDAAALDDLGGVARQYLNHRHEAAFGGDLAGVPLFVHAGDRDAIAEHRTVRASFSAAHTFEDDLDVIPTPGHTPGATAYLWDSGQHRFLFTGDTLYLRDGRWVAAVLGSSDRAAYLESLERIRGLDFDVLVPWAASAGDPYYAVTSNADARRRVNAIMDRIWRGEDH